MTSTAKSKENMFFKKFGRELVIRELCKYVFSLIEEEEAKLGWGGVGVWETAVHKDM